MYESRNGTHFADAESIRGVTACAAFTYGTWLGDRRQRTLTAILLKDIKLYASVVKLQDQEIVVPAICVRFCQEKFDDKQGPREATDEPHDSSDSSSYAEECWVSAAFWVYRLLVLRDVFTEFNPMLSAKEGDVLQVRVDCLQYYLVCDAQLNFWIDTAPTSVCTIGCWNKVLLCNLGTKPRGFSSHRSGFVSRSCILAIFAHRGKQRPAGTLEMVTRWGGWQVVTGTKTVMDIYARRISDHFVDPYSMINGLRVVMYNGSVLLSASSTWVNLCFLKGVVDWGRTQQPLQLRVVAWRSLLWQQHQSGL